MDTSSGESGIQDSAGFAAFVRAYKPVQLFTQFFDDPFAFIQDRIAGHLDDREAGAALSRLTISGPLPPRCARVWAE